MTHTYTPLDTVAVGCGAAEHIQYLSSNLDAFEEIAGTVVAVFDRVIYVSFEFSSTDLPRVFAIGDVDLRAGPLLTAVELAADVSFERLGLAPGTSCHLHVTPADIRLTVGAAVRLRIDPDMLPTLPVGQPMPTVDPTTFQRGSAGWQRHRDLLALLQSSEAADGIGWLAAVADHLSETADSKVEDLVDEMLSSRRNTDGVSLSLIGRGPGSTPTGDDILCGLLVAAHCFDSELKRRIRPTGRTIAHSAVGQTTPISREMLRQASLGRAAVPVRESFQEVLSGDHSKAVSKSTLQPVLDIGHTSGCALLAGMLTVTLAIVPASVGPE